MIEIENWLKQFLTALDEYFGDRVFFVGLQGSYGRGEATENSDIDMVVILDQVLAADLVQYRRMLDTLPCQEKLCGFLSGRAEIRHWDPADLFQLYFDTTPIRGTLDELRGMLDDAAVCRAINMGACNIYHGCVHNMLYGRSEAVLQGLYKCASFVVQAICYRRTGRYFRRQSEMIPHLSTEEREIVDTFRAMKAGEPVEFQAMSRRLFEWAGSWIRQEEASVYNGFVSRL